MNWFDRFLMVLEIALLWRMFTLDRENHKSIQEFLKSRKDWYARRAILKQTGAGSDLTEITKTPVANEANPGSDIVTVMQESEEEQQSSNS